MASKASKPSVVQKAEPRTWVLRLRKTDTALFEAIRSGRKSVETRAATKRYEKVAAGDRLAFVCGPERIEKEVQSVQRFASVDAMVKKIPFKEIMPDVSSIAEMKKVYGRFSGYEEKIRECGIVTLTLIQYV